VNIPESGHSGQHQTSGCWGYAVWKESGEIHQATGSPLGFPEFETSLVEGGAQPAVTGMGIRLILRGDTPLIPTRSKPKVFHENRLRLQ
jgi:hypothetical protein